MKYMATAHPISWFTDRNAEGNLTLQPDFQRRPVWTGRQKSNLIESILSGFPVPEIYMQIITEPDGRSEYVVVDGQQRVTAILDFVGAPQREPFELRYLDDTSPWSGYTFNDLTPEQRTAFYGHSMAVRYLQDATLEEIRDLFRRLNKYLTPLNAQEIRNATYKGPFLRLSETLAEESFWSENRLATPENIRRMRDIEFVSDLLIGVLHGPQSGNTKTIDDYYAIYEDHEREFPGQRDCRRRFGQSFELIQDLLPNIRNTRWSNRTDFYSLFVATAHLVRKQVLPYERREAVRERLEGFAADIIVFQNDEYAEVSGDVSSYVDAMRRGSSDKYRRGVRHQALLQVLGEFFEERG